MKSIIKKIKGVLKMAVIFSPVAVTLAGMGVGVYFFADGLQRKNVSVADVKNTTEYQQIVEEDLTTLNQQYQDKEISAKEFEDKKDSIGDEYYVRQILQKEGFEEQKANWQKGQIEFIAGLLGAIGSGIITSAASFAIFLHNEEKIDDIIANDFSDKPKIDEEKRLAEEKAKQEEDEYKEELV